MGQTCIKYTSNESENGSVIEYSTETNTITCYHTTPWYKRMFKKKKLGKVGAKYSVFEHNEMREISEEEQLNITYATTRHDWNNCSNMTNIDYTPYKDL